MQSHEYKVVPAPARAERQRGLKTTADRFAQTLAQTMNRLAAEGWEYLRCDTLPCEERVGLTGSKTVYQTVLVFRRALSAEVTAPAPAEAAPARPPLTALAPEGQAPRLGPTGAAAPPAPPLGPAEPHD